MRSSFNDLKEVSRKRRNHTFNLGNKSYHDIGIKVLPSCVDLNITLTITLGQEVQRKRLNRTLNRNTYGPHVDDLKVFSSCALQLITNYNPDS